MTTGSRHWDAGSYDRIGGPMTEMATAVVDRLPLAGDETVLDAGCGTGRVTELLLERLPEGKVIAADADPDMVRVARGILGRRAQIVHADLVELELDEPVDAILSTATFHWIQDHDALFRNLFTLLAPGGRLVAQCGGEGNIGELRDIGEDLTRDPRFAAAFEDWSAPWHYAGPTETVERLVAAGFVDVRAWLQPWPVEPDDPFQYLSTIILGAQVQHLPEERREPYIHAVIERASKPVTVGYVRLNIDASRPS